MNRRFAFLGAMTATILATLPADPEPVGRVRPREPEIPPRQPGLTSEGAETPPDAPASGSEGQDAPVPPQNRAVRPWTGGAGRMDAAASKRARKAARRLAERDR